MAVQIKLLRVLQEREVLRVGGDRLIPVDVRIISATNESLDEKVINGEFREDTFYRLNVLRLKIPPLRERVEVIPILVTELSKKISNTMKIKPVVIPLIHLNKLKSAYWPGNVRQLSNFIEQLMVLSEGKFNPHIFNDLYGNCFEKPLSLENGQQDQEESVAKYIDNKLKESEAQIINHLLERTNNDKSKVASLLGISRTTLWRKMKGKDSNN